MNPELNKELYLNGILTAEDEKHIKERLDPIVDAWMERFTLPTRTVRDRECVYELARNCYLTGMLVDGVMAQLEIEKENN